MPYQLMECSPPFSRNLSVVAVAVHVTTEMNEHMYKEHQPAAAHTCLALVARYHIDKLYRDYFFPAAVTEKVDKICCKGFIKLANYYPFRCC